MRKTLRLDPLIRIARQRERRLAGCLRQSWVRYSNDEAQRVELEAYRTQYLAALLPNQMELSARQLKDLWCFVERLDEAIAQSTRRADQSREQYGRDRQRFMTARARTKLLEGLMVRYRVEENKAAGRREHKEHDEYAGRIGAQRCCPMSHWR